ncbi:hypothetical protein [Streptomyces sp. ODS28]|uniref:hypothetical protein n=1 Tax=Streptomyces sp. ODS28 TaxID=3136688 RepID=UPI0031EE30A2
MRTLRVCLGLGGLALLVTGVVLLVADTYAGTVGPVLLWLAGAVGLHDLVLVPLVLACGTALRRLPARGVQRGALITGGCLTLIALPVMLRFGTSANPTVTPLDYPRGWALSLVCVVLAAAFWVAVRGVPSLYGVLRAGVVRWWRRARDLRTRGKRSRP